MNKMTKAYVDTNVVLRYFSNDIPEQAQLFEKRLEEVKQGKLHLVILPIVVIEIVYLLENWYKFPKEKIAEQLIGFFIESGIEIENKQETLEALKMYSSSSVDLVDILIWEFAKAKTYQVLSFDKHFDKLTPSIRMNP